MPKKKKIRQSLENLKDLEVGLEKIPKEKEFVPEKTDIEPKIQKESPPDKMDSKKLDDLLEKLKKWKVALKVNHDMQGEYRSRIQEFKEIREDFKAEINDVRESALSAKDKRDKINEKVTQLKKQRDEANQSIKDYKNKRDERWSQVKQIREQFRNILNQKKDLREKLFKAKKLSKIIDSLDWELQTVSMSWEKECELMDQIEEFFHQLEHLKEVKKFKSISDSLEEYSKQIEKFKNEANQYHQVMLDFVAESDHIHNQILEQVKESEIHHQDMITNFEKVNELRIQEEEAHQNMMNAVSEINLLKKGEQEIDKELQIIKRKLAKLREKEDIVKIEEANKILAEKAEKAFEKYKAGEKLTMDEFRILMKTDKLKE